MINDRNDLMNKSQKIYLIHAGMISVMPAHLSFQKHWPEARFFDLLDGSLVMDMKEQPVLTPSMMARFELLGDYCANAAATGVLFTCSAFGEAIERIKRKHAFPVLTPTEALFEEVIDIKGKIALVVTFGPSIAALTNELEKMAGVKQRALDIDPFVVEGAIDALFKNDHETHNRLIAEKAATLKGYEAIVFGQFTMSPAAPQAQSLTATPIMTTPDSAVKKLKRILTGS